LVLCEETHLESNALVILERTDIEGLSKASSTTGIGDDIILIIPFVSKDISEEMRV
jgi:hypothetical protein